MRPGYQDAQDRARVAVCKKQVDIALPILARHQAEGYTTVLRGSGGYVTHAFILVGQADA
jgi:hypothetical protein